MELQGEEFLFKPLFFKHGNELKIVSMQACKTVYYLPELTFQLDEGIRVKVRIYADLYEKGLIYEFESTAEIEIMLLCDIKYVNLLRFNPHNIEFKKIVKYDKWLGNPVVDLVSPKVSLSIAFGADNNFSYAEDGEIINLSIICKPRNCFYIAFNSDPDGASTTLIHLRRKGYQEIYQEFVDWLKKKAVTYPEDYKLETILNENLFFNYFFSIGKDMESDSYVALTSRSPRYYVSGAFWERDSFLWSFPAIRLVDRKLHREISREMIIRHSKNAGDHAHYIDGTVLYPGFELDQAASYFILIENMEHDFFDEEILKSLYRVLERIEREYDPDTGLYKTFLLPSDDPSEYPLVTIDNVILRKGYKNFIKVLAAKGEWEKVNFIKKRIEGIHEGIFKYLTGEFNGKKMFLWSADGKGGFSLYNDPPGNIGLMYFYGFVEQGDPLFANTIEYYYSPKYRYYFENANIKELACDHHPNTPSGLGLCGSLLNPLKRQEALEWLKKADMDYGLLSESFDKDSGEAKTGVGFATGAGYLAYVLYNILLY